MKIKFKSMTKFCGRKGNDLSKYPRYDGRGRGVSRVAVW